MELALITAQQVVVLFLLIGTGMVAVKTGVLKLENKQALSNLLVYIIVPAMVVNSYRMEFSAQILRNLLAAFGMSVLSVLLGTVITLLLTARKTGSRMPIFRFACIFSNAAYMGFPLISALFDSEGLLYASAYVTVFNILLWTLGYGLVSGGSKYVVEDDKVRLPFSALKGLGGAAADALERVTIHGEEYISVEELQQASGVGSSILDRLRQVGALGDLPESSQVSFF